MARPVLLRQGKHHPLVGAINHALIMTVYISINRSLHYRPLGGALMMVTMAATVAAVAVRGYLPPALTTLRRCGCNAV